MKIIEHQNNFEKNGRRSAWYQLSMCETYSASATGVGVSTEDYVEKDDGEDNGGGIIVVSPIKITSNNDTNKSMFGFTKSPTNNSTNTTPISSTSREIISIVDHHNLPAVQLQINQRLEYREVSIMSSEYK